MGESDILARLEAAIAARRGADPASSYVASLHAKGQDHILKTADLWFHCLVMLAWHGIAVADVLAELERREGRSGIEEKNSRPGGNAR
jgi:phosphoribosyl-ATP pyrophosphohydrolase